MTTTSEVIDLTGKSEAEIQLALAKARREARLTGRKTVFRGAKRAAVSVPPESFDFRRLMRSMHGQHHFAYTDFDGRGTDTYQDIVEAFADQFPDYYDRMSELNFITMVLMYQRLNRADRIFGPQVAI